LLAHGRWFFPSTPVFSTTKTGRHDIAEILLKVALKHQQTNKKPSMIPNRMTQPYTRSSMTFRCMGTRIK